MTRAAARPSPAGVVAPAAVAPPAAVAALARADPRLGRVIARVGSAAGADARRDYPRDHFAALVRAVLGQQVSVAAAAAMYARLLAHHGGRAPGPAEVLAADPETLRGAAGLSRAKLATLRALAAEVAGGRLDLDRLPERSDDDVQAALVAIRGIGPWTAQVFLMLHLERPDVVCPGDLGIRRAIRHAYELDALPDAAQVITLAQAWRPHRTLACRFLWASVAAGLV
ncbi:MAG TPA: DNA-3-methyladenine glycosylase 2 family protein [Solirubrobacteraceae bacterium]|nr:DNA-3-methyladenine glycosylase 2 family protein [Solirubrobacteraceae bacterium]